MAGPPATPDQSSSSATSPIVRSGPQRLATAVTALLIVVVLPLALVVIPNTISVLLEITPSELRAYGMALPALLVSVPLGALAARRLPSWTVMMAGLLILAAAEVAGRFVASVPVLAADRMLYGIGGGLCLAPSLVLIRACRRSDRRVLAALWVAMLVVSLLAAEQLALLPLLGSNARALLQPYPLATGVALVLLAVLVMLRLSAAPHELPRFRQLERTHLLTAVVPTLGIAGLIIGTTYNWSPVAQIVAGVMAVAALLGLAVAASLEGHAGRWYGVVMVIVGVAVLPVSGPIIRLYVRMLGLPAAIESLWLPMGLSAAAALLAALIGGHASRAMAGKLSAAGLVLVVAGLVALRLGIPAAHSAGLVLADVLLAGGAGLAVAAAMRRVELDTALFGLVLCFPAVFAGVLLGGAIQRLQLSASVRDSQQLIDALVRGLHAWTLGAAGGVAAVVVLAAVLWRTRDSSPRASLDL